MARENIITIEGNLTADPELAFTQSGKAVANFVVAQTPTFQRDGEWVDGDTNFFRCSVWGSEAENVAESLQKGMAVVAVGTLKMRPYETQDGRKGTSIDVGVRNIGPSLKFATATVTKNIRSGAPQGGMQQPMAGRPPTAPPAKNQQGQAERSTAPQRNDPWATPGADNQQSAFAEEPPF